MSIPHPRGVAAIVAAAGQSVRMGKPKQLLPWKDSTVIAAVVDNLTAAGAHPVIVVTGHKAAAVEAALADTAAIIVINDEFARSEVLRSYQIGLRRLTSTKNLDGALLTLGDQPHISPQTLRQIIDEAHRFPGAIIVPSFAMRRGHPVFLPVSLWKEALTLGADDTLRTLLSRHEDKTRYVIVDTSSILRDLDTPDDYEALRPK